METTTTLLYTVIPAPLSSAEISIEQTLGSFTSLFPPLLFQEHAPAFTAVFAIGISQWDRNREHKQIGQEYIRHL